MIDDSARGLRRDEVSNRRGVLALTLGFDTGLLGGSRRRVSIAESVGGFDTGWLGGRGRRVSIAESVSGFDTGWLGGRRRRVSNEQERRSGGSAPHDNNTAPRTEQVTSEALWLKGRGMPCVSSPGNARHTPGGFP